VALEVKDVVGVSSETYSAAVKQAVEEAARTMGTIDSAELMPPYTAVVTGQKVTEFRATVRIFYYPH
jgi:flavin-binding protein dodecin